MIKISKKVKRWYSEVLATKTSSHSIALGFSIGTFVAILPTFMFGAIICTFIVFLYKDLNKYSLFAALAVWNPLTLFPIYIISKKIGNLLFGNATARSFEFEIFNQVFDFTRRFLVGNMILAIFFSIGSYYIVKYIIDKKRSKHISRS